MHDHDQDESQRAPGYDPEFHSCDQCLDSGISLIDGIYCQSCNMGQRIRNIDLYSAQLQSHGVTEAARMVFHSTQRTEKAIAAAEKALLLDKIAKLEAGKACAAQDEMHADMLIGLSVSMDVSTGDDDAGHRIFGKVIDTMPSENGITILAEEESRNFDAPQPIQVAPAVAAVVKPETESKLVKIFQNRASIAASAYITETDAHRTAMYGIERDTWREAARLASEQKG